MPMAALATFCISLHVGHPVTHGKLAECFVNLSLLIWPTFTLVLLARSSQILRTLNRTYVNMKQKAIWSDLNPKAVTTDELFGFIHHATREWKDGKYYFLSDTLKNAFLSICF